MEIIHAFAGSPASQRALAAARRLRERVGGRVVLIHARAGGEHPLTGFETTSGAYNPTALPVETDFQQRMRGVARDSNARTRERERRWLAAHALAGEDALVLAPASGRPLDALEPHLRRSDLVAIGVGANRFGGHAARLVARGVVAVLSCTAEARVEPVRSVMVASDLRPAGYRAVAWAVRVFADAARAGDIELHLVHVAPTAQRGRDENALRRAVEAGRAAGLPWRATVLTADRPARAAALGELALRTGSDLLIVGARRRPPELRALLGSVGLALLRAAPVPVIHVPQTGGGAAGRDAAR